MQAAFIEAVVNRRHAVLGRPLHDFCLYDALALTIAGNPLWVGGVVEMEHLQQAVLICSLEPGRLLTATLDPRNRWERFARQLWKAHNRRRDFETHLALWRAYEADYYAPPEFWPAEGKRFSAPWLYSLAVHIEMHSNMREEEILSAPIGRMFWKSATISERSGTSAADMMTQEEIEIGRLQVAAQQAAQAEKAAAPAAAKPEQKGA